MAFLENHPFAILIRAVPLENSGHVPKDNADHFTEHALVSFTNHSEPFLEDIICLLSAALRQCVIKSFMCKANHAVSTILSTSAVY